MTRRHDSRVLIVALVLPITLVAVALGVVIAWLPQLPPTVAVHWGLTGPDRFAPRITLPVVLALLGFGLPALLGGLVIGTARSGLGVAQKLLAVVSLGTALLLAIAFVGAAGAQRGLSGGESAPDLLPTMLIGFAVSIAAAAVAWFVLPKAVRTVTSWRAATPLPLTAEERAVWIGSARFRMPVAVAILVPTLIVAAVSSFAAAQRGGAAWLLLLIPVFVFVIVLSSIDWRVRVDAAGLRVRSILGLPRWTIPIDDIAAAGTTTVSGLTEFGGWGVRWASRSRVGVITRSGPALEVRRRDGSSLVVTVDDAETAAALLAARVSAISPPAPGSGPA